MKKAISVLLALCLTCAFGVSVSAADVTLNPTAPTGDTVISTTVEPSYVVTIPATLAIPFGDTSAQTLTVTASAADFCIAAGEKVDVSVSTESGAFALSNNTNTIAYTVNAGATGQNGVVASFTAAGQSQGLSVTVPDWSSAHTSGTYSQSLIFTLTYSGVV